MPFFDLYFIEIHKILNFILFAVLHIKTPDESGGKIYLCFSFNSFSILKKIKLNN